MLLVGDAVKGGKAGLLLTGLSAFADRPSELRCLQRAAPNNIYRPRLTPADLLAQR